MRNTSREGRAPRTTPHEGGAILGFVAVACAPTIRPARPRPATPLSLRAVPLLLAAVAALLSVGPAMAAYEGLQNPALDGPAEAGNGFTLGIQPSIWDLTTTVAPQTEMAPGACDTAPASPPEPGLVRSAPCAVDLGKPGPTTDWAAIQSIKLLPDGLGNKLARMASFTAYHNVPNGVPASEVNVRYQFYYRIDTNEDSAPDVCVVQQTGFVQPPVSPGKTAAWEQVTFSADSPAMLFMATDAACSECADGPGTCTQLQQSGIQAKYPTARILSLHVQSAHTDGDGDGDYGDWPAGYPMYFDDFALTMDEDPGVLLAVGGGVAVDEDGPASDSYMVSLSAPPAGGETVTVTPDEDPGAGSPDQASLSGAVSFTAADWNVPKAVTVTAVDDAFAEADVHTTTLRHTAASTNPLSAYNAVTVPSFQVQVADNDLAGVNPDPAAISLSEAAPAATATFDVELGSSPGPGETVTVTLTPDARQTLDTDPLAAGDQSTLTFTALDPLSKPVVVTVVDDAVDQANLAAGAITGTVASNVPGSQYDGWPFPGVTVAIQDDDPDVTIAAAGNGNELGSVAGLFTVTRGPDTSQALTVTYTVAGSATSGADFTALPGSILIAAGDASAMISVPVLGDALDEATETVTVTLVATTVPYTAGGAGAAATLDILDDDDPAVTVAATVSAASEAGPTVGKLTLTRGNTDLAIDVDVTLSGTAAAGDYGASLASPVHFDAGEAERTMLITPVDDAADEPAETVVLTVDAGAGYVVGAASQATVTIADDDAPTVSVAVTAAGADEEGPVAGTFTLTRTAGDTAADLAVAVTVTGTATAGTDYATIGPTVTIPGGVTSVDVSVTPVDDGVNEGAETVVLTLAAGAYVVAAAPDQAGTVTIADNDYVVSVAATTASASEVGPVAGVYTLTRDHAGPGFAVQLSWSGTAAAPGDHAALPATVSFAAGATTATYAIVPIADGVDEAPETAVLTVQAAAPYAVGPSASATVTIADGDAPVATADAFLAYRDCPTTIGAAGVLANDVAPAPLSYAAVAASGATSQGGTYSLAADGGFAYTPPAGFLGTDTFTYRDTDGTYSSLPATVSLAVAKNHVPAVAILANPSTPIAGQAVEFRGVAPDPDGPLLSWQWTFGDGGHGGGPAIQHAFATPGIYVVSLRVADGQCGTSTTTRSIQVRPAAPAMGNAAAAPLGKLEAGLGGGAEGAATLTVGVDGDREATAGNAVHMVATASRADAAVAWTQTAGPPVGLAIDGATGRVASFTAPAGGTPLSFLVTATWGGQTATAAITVDVGSPTHGPVAVAGAPMTVAAGAPVTLDGSASHDADGDPLAFAWTQWSGPAVAIHDPLAAAAAFVAPAGPAELRFLLTVDDGASTSTAVQVVRVAAPAGDLGVGDPGGGAGSGAFDVAVHEDGRIVATPRIAAREYAWDFGDGATDATRGAAKHTYAQDGAFTVRLTVQDPAGEAVTFARDVHVEGARSRPPAAEEAQGPQAMLLLLGVVAAALVVGALGVALAARRRMR